MSHRRANCALLLAAAILLVLLVACWGRNDHHGRLLWAGERERERERARRHAHRDGFAGAGAPLYCSHAAATKNTCVQCDDAHPCTSPLVCSPGNTCVNCNSNADCPAGQYCYNNECVPCVSGDPNFPCASGVCSTDSSSPNTCVQCNVDTDCNSPAPAKFTSAPAERAGSLPPGWAPSALEARRNVSPVTSNCLYGPYDEESSMCSFNGRVTAA